MNSMITGQQQQVDVSLSRRFGDRLERILSGNKITGEDLYLRSEQGGNTAQYYERPRIYSLAVRVAF